MPVLDTTRLAIRTDLYSWKCSNVHDICFEPARRSHICQQMSYAYLSSRLIPLLVITSHPIYLSQPILSQVQDNPARLWGQPSPGVTSASNQVQPLRYLSPDTQLATKTGRNLARCFGQAIGVVSKGPTAPSMHTSN